MDEITARTGSTPPQLIVVGEFLLDRETIRVWRGKKPLKLSMRQFRLMDVFMQHPGATLTRKFLKEMLWGPESTIADTNVDVEIGRLRQAIGGRKREAPIRTVHKSGYVFEIRKRKEGKSKPGGVHLEGRP